MEVCPKNVFTGINLLWHNHIKVVNAGNCIGCLKCINACSSGVLMKVK